MTDDSLEIPTGDADAPPQAGDAGTVGGPADAGDTDSGSLALEAPAPVAAVSATGATAAVPISDADRAKLDAIVGAYLDAVSSLDPHGEGFAAKVGEIDRLGNEDIRSAAAVSNRLLQKPIAALAAGGLPETSSVGTSLRELRRQVEELDPARQGNLLAPRKLLGLLPFGAGDRLRDYFDKYRSSQGHIEAIITALGHGQAELERDNAAIAAEKANLWATMSRLRQYAYLAERLDSALAGRIAAIDATDPDRAKALEEDMLFSIRQKRQDLLTQLAVSVQGYLALDVIRRNNGELIKGVQRATTTTVSALRTAVVVAQALADQKLVLDQITALNATTSQIIESTSALLRQQSAAVNQQAASSTVELGALQTAFTNIYATMDEIDAFRIAALDTMEKTVTALTGEIARAQPSIERIRSSDPSTSTVDRVP